MITPTLVTLLAVAPRILIYTATEGYRHESIETATAALFQLGQKYNIEFDHTEDRALFNDKNLAKYDALLFLNNNDEVLNESGKQAFQRYLNKGGNYVGVHGGGACLYNTTFYQREVGALFDYHPDLQPATKRIQVPSTCRIDGHILKRFITFVKIPVMPARKFCFQSTGTAIMTTLIELKPKVLLIPLHGIKNGALERKIAVRLVEAFIPV
ncbi:unnamed protein product [Rhizoctonia solani]|uniref:ThuA-like domain-containing protein n=1 Tax=Rhizoctonia solani TaxID=456999 RepID=A0A8H3DL81_9AGAM|nr:unnamed protein product [Rhizoctonia solani]CAE6531355.1 unnamed protein product [Rhizoctonia solani]